LQGDHRSFFFPSGSVSEQSLDAAHLRDNAHGQDGPVPDTPVVMSAIALDADVLIVGGGLNGPVTALALAQAGLRVTLCDAASAQTRADPEFDGRAYSMALASKRLLEAIGVWQAVEAEAQPVWDIVVTDGRRGEAPSPLFLHFDHRELDEGVGSWLVEDRHLRPAP
jgi:2-octaprenyl-6-methoxyphenol hydroxylase